MLQLENMKHEHSQASIILQSGLAVPLTILVWMVVYVLAYIALGLLDSVRGLGSDLVQSIFRELFTPGVGGFAAIYAAFYCLSRANPKFVFWAFIVPVFLFMIGFPVLVLFFLPEGWTFSWWEQVLRWLGGATTILGAWLAHKNISQT